MAAGVEIDTPTGAPQLTFEDGRRLTFDADEFFESWMCTGPNRHQVVSLPGGEVAEFRAADE